MGRVEDLRAEVQKLYEEAAEIADSETRLTVILRALELETEADMLARQNLPPPEAPQHVAQQQQQPQPDDDKPE